VKLKLILFLIAVSFSCYSDAQWYTSKYGVEDLNDLSNEQLMECYSNASTTFIVGIPLTLGGAGLMLGGFVWALSAGAATVVTLGTYEPESYGGELIIAGAVVTCVGIPLWITGGVRRKELRPTLISRGLISNISILPGAGYDLMTHTYYPAMTLRIQF